MTLRSRAVNAGYRNDKQRRHTCATRPKEKESRPARSGYVPVPRARYKALEQDSPLLWPPPRGRRERSSEGTRRTRERFGPRASWLLPLRAVFYSRSWLRGESRRPICFVTANERTPPPHLASPWLVVPRHSPRLACN